jgi:phage virion morphogenesis protein
VRIGIDFARLTRRLQEAARRAQRMSEAFDEVGEIVLRSIRRNFDEGGRPSKWPARSTKYTGRRAGNKLLIDTGRLLNSITRRSTPSYAEVGTNTVYAATHHFGDRGIPARPFIMVQDEDREPIAEALIHHIMRPFT